MPIRAASESALLARIRLKFSRGAVRLFRNNCAMAYVGTVVSRTSTRVILENWRPLHAGLHVGSGDLIGWKTVTITPDMIGARVAVFVSVETKAATNPSPDQRAWLAAVLAAGGIAGVVRSEEECVLLLGTGASPATTAEK